MGSGAETPFPALLLSLCLLLDVVLSSALLRLARVVLLLILELSIAIARETGHGAADRPGQAVAHATSEVVELALGLLLLALEVLVATGLLQGLVRVVSACSAIGGGGGATLWQGYLSGLTHLGADEPTQRLLRGSDSLVPRPGRPVRVVLGHGARRRSREAGALERRVRRVVFGLALVLLDLTLGLVACAARQVADGVLDGARSRVDVRLESGRVVVGHGDLRRKW